MTRISDWLLISGGVVAVLAAVGAAIYEADLPSSWAVIMVFAAWYGGVRFGVTVIAAPHASDFGADDEVV